MLAETLEQVLLGLVCRACRHLPRRRGRYRSVNLVDSGQAQYFVAGVGVVTVPVTGSPDPPGTVLGEADYLPDGDLFVSRFCCEGTPGSSVPSLLWEVSATGALVHQVAMGNPDFGHSSLDVSQDGR
jgi:hypothetical protein